MDMARLLDSITVRSVSGDVGGIDVARVTPDSRLVQAGSLFVAVRGTEGDGHAYVDKAIQAGAVAVCGERPLSGLPVPYVQVADSRWAVAHLAEALHGFPGRSLRLVGVTGTNGKTSTATLVRGICERAGVAAGLLGTVSYDVGAGEQPAPTTTPGPVELSALLAAAREHGKRVVALEVSSHAIAQSRVAALEFDVAVFTNCTQDHLDYHGDMDQYFGAKRRLFECLGMTHHKREPKRAVVNAEDAYADQVIAACRVPVWTYAVESPADIRATNLRLGPAGTRARVETPAGEADLDLRLLGRHNVSNALAALGAGLALDIPLETAVAALNAAPCVPGRCEMVDAGQPFTVIVDYAHTPDGLRALLETCRALRPARVVTVFGCGGDRDRTKRPQMGELVGRLSDAAIVTSDNPRTEDPTGILLDIEVGLQRAGCRRGEDYELVEDRRAAIAQAIAQAEPGDLVVIAGKGHEPYQIIGTDRREFDDRVVARECLAEHGTGRAC